MTLSRIAFADVSALLLGAALAAALTSPAQAQSYPLPPRDSGAPSGEAFGPLIDYGREDEEERFQDPDCDPVEEGGIIVCAEYEDGEEYRIPEELRGPSEDVVRTAPTGAAVLDSQPTLNDCAVTTSSSSAGCTDGENFMARVRREERGLAARAARSVVTDEEIEESEYDPD